MGLPFNRIANPLLYGFDCAISFLYGFDGATLLLFFAGGDFILAGIIQLESLSLDDCINFMIPCSMSLIWFCVHDGLDGWMAG